VVPGVVVVVVAGEPVVVVTLLGCVRVVPLVFLGPLFLAPFGLPFLRFTLDCWQPTLVVVEVPLGAPGEVILVSDDVFLLICDFRNSASFEAGGN